MGKALGGAQGKAYKALMILRAAQNAAGAGYGGAGEDHEGELFILKAPFAALYFAVQPAAGDTAGKVASIPFGQRAG